MTVDGMVFETKETVRDYPRSDVFEFASKISLVLHALVFLRHLWHQPALLVHIVPTV